MTFKQIEDGLCTKGSTLYSWLIWSFCKSILWFTEIWKIEELISCRIWWIQEGVSRITFFGSKYMAIEVIFSGNSIDTKTFLPRIIYYEILTILFSFRGFRIDTPSAHPPPPQDKNYFLYALAKLTKPVFFVCHRLY